jgi:hypothetical protein
LILLYILKHPKKIYLVIKHRDRFLKYLFLSDTTAFIEIRKLFTFIFFFIASQLGVIVLKMQSILFIMIYILLLLLVILYVIKTGIILFKKEMNRRFPPIQKEKKFSAPPSEYFIFVQDKASGTEKAIPVPDLDGLFINPDPCFSRVKPGTLLIDIANGSVKPTDFSATQGVINKRIVQFGLEEQAKARDNQKGTVLEPSQLDKDYMETVSIFNLLQHHKQALLNNNVFVRLKNGEHFSLNVTHAMMEQVQRLQAVLSREKAIYKANPNYPRDSYSKHIPIQVSVEESMGNQAHFIDGRYESVKRPDYYLGTRV